MKTVQEYMNDPRITNDPEMMAALEPIREIHAIRLKHQDETAGMSPEEIAEYYNKKSAAFLARSGLSLCYNLAGQGRLPARVSF
ncbi:MAG: hypothetical protein LBG10_06465 [Treponema sp.]|jgi:hypothetical protein|nr:hypothetical protein [Treponema sp.]